MTRSRLPGALKACELPIALLALAVVPALVLEDRATDPSIRTAAYLTNWFVWLVFCAEYVARLWVAPKRAMFLRSAWFDLTIILLSPPFLVPEQMASVRALRAARLLRLARLLRAFGVAMIGLRMSRRVLKAHNFHYVLVVAASTVGVGAIAIYAVEHGTNPNIGSIGDALWWAVVTTTTVGYGDISPTTAEGRVIAVALMFVGISVVGIFTATLASLFFEQGKDEEKERLIARLDSIEAKLDHLIEQNAGNRLDV